MHACDSHRMLLGGTKLNYNKPEKKSICYLSGSSIISPCLWVNSIDKKDEVMVDWVKVRGETLSPILISIVMDIRVV